MTITDNIYIEVVGGIVYIGHCAIMENIVIRWSSNPDFIKWISLYHDQSENEFEHGSKIYNKKYESEYQTHAETLWKLVKMNF